MHRPGNMQLQSCHLGGAKEAMQSPKLIQSAHAAVCCQRYQQILPNVRNELRAAHLSLSCSALRIRSHCSLQRVGCGGRC